MSIFKQEKMSGFIKGTCKMMCPEKERWMREREGLLHRFEIDETTRGMKRPKADPKRTVKCYSRPAAGQIMTDPDQLRPGPVLLFTVKYLLTEIVTRTDTDWLLVYDFVFDRLRAVRQDVVIQRIEAPVRVQIFEPIVRFLVYASHRLCERDVTEFDGKINHQHLLECIKNLLLMYDELEKIDINCDAGLNLCLEKMSLNNNRPQMEALYILLNIGDPDALNRALNLPSNLRQSPEVRLAMNISFAWYLKNYVRVCSMIQKLPPILLCAAMINLRSMRRTALKVMSTGYNSKTLTFPGVKLQEILLYKDIEKVRADCELFGQQFVDQNVRFQKANFKDDVKLAGPEMYYTPQTLYNFLPRILLESS